MAAPDSFRFAHFEVLRKADGSAWELGRGGMGVTYKAFDTKLKVDVVLKLPHEQLLGSERNLRLFLREARAAAKVRHPNIAAVIHLQDEAPLFYVMEFVAGQPLDALLRERKTLPLGEALDVVDQLASALHALAAAQIVHRDLKPANLVLLPDDERPFGRTVKLIDFGLAKGFASDGGEAATYLQNSLSQAGVFSGTAAFASPEQCAGALELDARSDLYSAGVILWQMLTGGLPFTGTLQQVIARQQLQPPPWEALGGVPEPVVAILRRLLAKEPDDRYPQPRALRDAIRAAGALLSTEQLGAATVAVPAGAEARRPTEALKLGTTLVARYRLGEDCGDGDGGRLFRAADNASGDAPVAVKAVASNRLGDQSFVEALTRQLEVMRSAPHPVWLAARTGLERSGDGAFFVREWAEGFSLDELLRARQGELSAPEVWRLLGTLPDAIDAAVAARLPCAEPILRKLFVTPAPGASPDDDWPGLRRRSLREWPAFRLRWNVFSFRKSAARGPADHDVTEAEGEACLVVEDAVVPLALLVHQLLGGAPGARKPLATLRGEANAVLQRALGLGGGQRAFGTARRFWDELRRASGVDAVPVREGGALAAAPTLHSTPPAAELVPGALGAASPAARRPHAHRAPMLAFVGACAVLLVGSFLLAPNPRGAAPPAATAMPPSAPGTGVPPLPVAAPPPVVTSVPTTSVRTPTVGAAFAGRQAGERRTILGIPFRWCPPGRFRMGSAAEQTDHVVWEKSHEVTLTRGFWLAETELTQAQWTRFVATNPTYFKGAEDPVADVGWQDAQAWCTSADGALAVAGWRVALPTEAQWEYACRAGTESRWSFGESISIREANIETVPAGSGTPPAGRGRPVRVGSYPANAWGLRDMHGNVAEWCADWYGDYEVGRSQDPTGPATGTRRVLRGGGYNDNPAACRSAARESYKEDMTLSKLGFRPAVVPAER